MISKNLVSEIKSKFKGAEIHNLENEIRWFVEEKIFPSGNAKSIGVLPSDAEDLIHDFVVRRSNGEPLAYILGNQDFMGLRFEVTPAVLIPRRETEELVECVEREYGHVKSDILFADLGSGSGCIGISLSKRNPKFKGDLIEISKDAQVILDLNRRKLGVEALIVTYNESVETYFGYCNKMYDLIVANPPYIEEQDPRVDPTARKYEPNIALFAKNKGMDLIMNWQDCAFDHLKVDGAMYIEIGHEQGRELKDFFEAKNLNFKIYQDLQGRDRWIRLKR